MRGKGVTKQEKVLAKAARDRVKELIKKAFWLESLDGGKKDKYGRILGNIYTLNGLDVAKTLIDEGHAVAYDGGTKTHKWA
jgi:endonuclease YncB( thermonuclease family)